MALFRLICERVKEVKVLTPVLWRRAMAIEIDSFKDKETAEEVQSFKCLFNSVWSLGCVH